MQACFAEWKRVQVLPHTLLFLNPELRCSVPIWPPNSSLAVLASVAAATFAIFWLIERRNWRARILKERLAGKLRILLA